MKKLLLVVLILLSFSNLLFSQVAINSDGSSPHPSAGLDVNFVNKGMLLPRMTFEQINAIADPAEGLIIYCTNCNLDASGALSIFQGGNWKIFTANCTAPYTPSITTNVRSLDQIEWNWASVPIALGYKWNTINDFNTAQDLGLVTSMTETGLTCWTTYTRYLWAYNSCGQSQVLEIIDSTLMEPVTPAPFFAGFTPTDTTIMWVWGTVPGAVGYKWNTEDDFSTAFDVSFLNFYWESGLSCLTEYTRYAWAYDDCGRSTPTTMVGTTASNPPDAPVEDIHNPSVTQIVWNWDPVAGATGYKWNTTDDYGTATDMLTTTTTTETDLTCNLSYTRYVWAYSDCGASDSTILIQATLLDPPAFPLASLHQSTPIEIVWNWNPVAGVAGYKWNTIDDYGTASDMGTDTTSTETGLVCNTPYTRYVWAYDNCGVSTSAVLSQSTSLDPPAAPASTTHVPTPNSIVWNWDVVADADGYKWNSTNDYGTAIEMGPELSYLESSLSCNTPYTRYVWSYNDCGVSASAALNQSTSLDPPAAPVSSTHNPTPDQIEWNWDEVSGAAGYKWNTTNDYVSAEDMGSSTSKTETGLTCNSSYTRYIWAYSSCGVSTSTSLGQATSLDPPANPVADTHFPSLTEIVWNWNTVPEATGYKWNTTNDIGTAEEMSTATSKTETGLICNSSYTRYVWAYSPCGVSSITSLTQATSQDPPAAPTAATHVPTPEEIEWKWNPVAEATGYKWNTTSNYGSATDMGTDTATIETGLTCNSGYTRYIWAYNDCGVSELATLTQSTALDPPAAPVTGTHTATAVQIVWNWNTVSGATGYRWNTVNDYGSAQDMGTSISKTQTSLTCNTSYTSYIWAYSNCGVSSQTSLTQATELDPPAAPVAGTHVPTPVQIEWNWNTVTGATGYRWNSVNDYNTAEDLGAVTLKTETSLTCNTSYTRYVWAYSDCGVSGQTTLTQLTSLDPPDVPVAGTHVPSLTQIVWNWNAVSGATGYKWNTTNNLGTAEDMFANTTKTEDALTCNHSYTRYIWAYSDCGTSTAVILNQSTSVDPPDDPVAGTHTATGSEIVWNWNVVSGATGYKWNTEDNYSTAQDMGTNTSNTEPGLSCNTPFTRYVWAYGPCGISSSTTLSESTADDVPGAPGEATHAASALQITWNWNTVSGATGYKWNTTDDFGTAQELGGSNSKIETGLTCNTAYNRYVWAYNGCGNSASTLLSQSTTQAPVAPTAGTHIALFEEITWVWNSVSDATGYKWNTVNNYSSAIEMGSSTSKVETGLTCGSNYTRYAWAYNSCGESTALTLNGSTANCWTCGENIPVNHVTGSVAPVNKSTTYGTVTNIPGETSKCWITSNLGSDQQASNWNDGTEASAGWYWQFNRMQGYKHDGTNRTPNSSWISSIDEYSNWITASDPCAIELGTGWRLPTSTEWTNVDAGGNWSNIGGPWLSDLKMHYAGRLDRSSGNLIDRGGSSGKGAYWSGTQSGSNDWGQNLYFFSSGCSVSMFQKAYGFTVRCLKD